MKRLFQFAILFALPPFAFAGPKLAKDLPPGSSKASVDVIVQFNTPPSKDDLKQLGAFGQVKKNFDSIKAVQGFRTGGFPDGA